MILKIKYLTKITILLALSINLSSLAQDNNLDIKKMNRDIRIMEKILDKILSHKNNSSYFQPQSVKGIYMPEFGLIFHVQQSPFQKMRIKIMNKYMNKFDETQTLYGIVQEDHKESINNLKEMKEKRIEAHIKSGVPARIKESDGNIIDKEKEVIENLKSSLFIFFNRYASSLKQLNSNSKIAVIIDLDDWDITNSGNSYLTSLISFNNLNKYRSNKISKNDFKKLIVTEISKSDNKLASDIEIMNEIINEGLDFNHLHRPSYNNGIYLKDLGVIFFMEIPRYSPGYFITKKKLSKMNDLVWQIEEDKTKPDKEKFLLQTEEKMNNQLSKLKDNIIDILASYGHTLQLKPEEYIIMNINLGEKFMPLNSEEKIPSCIIIKIRKKYLTQYYNDKISLKNLQKNMVIRTLY